MKVLITNDDGVQSAGIRHLREKLKLQHDVWTVAPHIERSCTSHAITLHGSVVFKKLKEKLYSCDGTPADSVKYSLLGAIPFSPDVVVSGINHGPNIGTDIVYSGTVAAAREAAYMGCAGIAVSLAGAARQQSFQAAARFISENLEVLVDSWKDNHLINVNVPGDLAVPLTTKITTPARRIYRDRLVSESVSDSELRFAIEGEASDAAAEGGSDWEAVTSGFISISPILIHPLNHSVDEAYHSLLQVSSVH